MVAVLLFLPAAAGFVLFSPWGRIEDPDGDGGYITDPYINRYGNIEWASPESFNLYESVFLWGRPASALSQDGLGGGITWALHPNFCNGLLPHFPEASRAGTFATFITCADIRHAVSSAFATWSANHEQITFLDVTDRCTGMTGTTCADAEVVLQLYDTSTTEAAKTVLDVDTVDFACLLYTSPSPRD